MTGSAPSDQLPGRVEVRVERLDGPAGAALVRQVQQEYVDRYGGPDATPVDPAEFDEPGGVFLVVYRSGVPVACGGFRAGADGVAEIKRMFVVPAQRRQGLARLVLDRLERRAAAAGYRTLRLETGAAQPEALAMYRTAGYTPVAPFGLYRCTPGSHHLGKDLPGEGD